MNLEPFIYRKVIVEFRNGSSKIGTLIRSLISSDYPYIFDNHYYTKRGEILIDKLSKYDIISIQLVEEPKMTEPNYKEFADRFYNLLKENSFYRGIPVFNEVVKEYENATKPKLTYVKCIAGDAFVYEGKDYARIGRFWYRIERSVLTFVEDDELAGELIYAHLEWEKTK